MSQPDDTESPRFDGRARAKFYRDVLTGKAICFGGYEYKNGQYRSLSSEEILQSDIREAYEYFRIDQATPLNEARQRLSIVEDSPAPGLKERS